MSQVSDKLKWCLNKATKELIETGRHRGLLRKEPNLKLAEKHLVKAEHNLDAAFYFAEGGYSDWSASAFFYSLYHCFLAILAQHGYESRNQECTLAAIETLKEERKLEINQEYINLLKTIKNTDESAIQLREDGVELEFRRKEELNRLAQVCKELIEVTKEIIHK